MRFRNILYGFTIIAICSCGSSSSVTTKVSCTGFYIKEMSKSSKKATKKRERILHRQRRIALREAHQK